MGRFDQDSTHVGTAGFRNGTLVALRATGGLARDQADTAYDRPRMRELSEVAQFGDDGRGGDPINAAQCLQSDQQGCGRMHRHRGLDQALEASDPGIEFFELIEQLVPHALSPFRLRLPWVSFVE